MIDELFFEFGILRIDDHTVGNTLHKALNVPGPHPNGDSIRRDTALDEYFREALTRSRLNSLHAKDKHLILNGILHNALHKAAKSL